MAKGDWAAGTKLVPVMVNVTFDRTTLTINHVGVGYHLVLPSGQERDGAYTWHSPQGGYASAPADQVKALAAVMAALLQAAATAEGVTL